MLAVFFSFIRSLKSKFGYFSCPLVYYSRFNLRKGNLNFLNLRYSKNHKLL